MRLISKTLSFVNQPLDKSYAEKIFQELNLDESIKKTKNIDYEFLLRELYQIDVLAGKNISGERSLKVIAKLIGLYADRFKAFDAESRMHDIYIPLLQIYLYLIEAAKEEETLEDLDHFIETVINPKIIKILEVTDNLSKDYALISEALQCSNNRLQTFLSITDFYSKPNYRYYPRKFFKKYLFPKISQSQDYNLSIFFHAFLWKKAPVVYKKQFNNIARCFRLLETVFEKESRYFFPFVESLFLIKINGHSSKGLHVILKKYLPRLYSNYQNILASDQFPNYESKVVEWLHLVKHLGQRAQYDHQPHESSKSKL